MPLLICAGRGAAEAVVPGAQLLAWDKAAAQALASARVPFDSVDSLLGPAARDAADDAAIAWTKEFGVQPLLEGRNLRQLILWKGMPLFYFAELYLHHSTAAPGYVRSIELFHRLLEKLAPTEVETRGMPPVEALLLQRTCTALGILFHGSPRAPRAFGREAAVSLRACWNTLKLWLAVLKSLLSPAPPRSKPDGPCVVLFLSHAAFWRSRRDEQGAEQPFEHYFDALLPAVTAQASLAPFVLAVGPRAAFRRRRWRDRLGDWLRLRDTSAPYVHVERFTSPAVAREVARATSQVRGLWRSLRRSPALHEAFSHRGAFFFDLTGADLAATLLLQLPWAVRSYEEMGAALDAVQPALVILYAESSGWGRAATGACRSRGVATLALQHGILYPRYYSYLHGPDEADCPRPDKTAVFGAAAKRFLVEKGSYPEDALVVTGSPKFDALVALGKRLDRESLRRRLGAGPEDKLLLLASRFRAIRETHRSVGGAFPALVAASESLPGVRLLVKPHPAESEAPYIDALRAARAKRAALAESGAELLELLVAADALVTVESLSAVEALVLDRPVLVLDMPTNLSEMVEQGMALGVSEGQDPRAALSALLFDEATRNRLAAARRRYLADVAHGVDGQATARILALVETMAASRRAASAC